MPDFKEFITNDFNFFECRIIYYNSNTDSFPMIKVGLCDDLNNILNVLYNIDYVSYIGCCFRGSNSEHICNKVIKDNL